MKNLKLSRAKSPLRRALPFLLTGAVAVAAILLVIAWGVVRYHNDQIDNGLFDESDPALGDESVDFSETAVSNRLLIFDETGYERFVLIQTHPAEPSLYVWAIPGDLSTGDGTTATSLLRKFGAARATQGIAEAIGLSVPHYISFDGTGAEAFLNHLENGVVFSLSQAVDFQDPTGTRVTLTAGDTTLTAVQSISLLRYAGWQGGNADEYSASLVSAILHQYLTENRSFSDDFAVISNSAKTDIRIGDFAEAKSMLRYLAQKNSGTLCHAGQYPTTVANGKRVADQKTAFKNGLSR